MVKEIVICGSMGESVDGQTIKTLRMAEALEAIEGSVLRVNMAHFKCKPCKAVWQMAQALFKGDVFILMPGSNSIRLLLPLFAWWKKHRKVLLVYVGVGGWLQDRLKKDHFLRECARCIDAFYMENAYTLHELDELGFSSCHHLPNFRNFNPRTLPRFRSKPHARPKLLFFSRITPEKGVERCIRSVAQLLKEFPLCCQLDLYGPIAKNYKRAFLKLLDEAPAGIHYGGILEPSDASLYQQLSDYDLLVFPTFYEGEGMSGAMIECLVAGVPVLASNWKGNAQLITPGRNGLLFELDQQNEPYATLKMLIFEPKMLERLRRETHQQFQHYHGPTLVREMLINLRCLAKTK